MSNTIVKINAIRVPEGMGEMIEGRFAARADAMKEVGGFLGFELLRPVAGDERYFVYTRWVDEASYQAWRDSQQFAESHAGQGGPPSGDDGGDGGPPKGPMAQGADLLEFEVALSVDGNP